MQNQIEIEERAMASHARRNRANGIQTQPAKWATTVDTERHRVVLRNVNGILAVYTYRDDGHRIVFREADDRLPEDDVY